MTEETATEVEFVDIYLGDEFTLSQSYSMSSDISASITKLIFVIGPTEAGKTTLLTKIFDRFQNGPIGDWTFVGSETIVGYEKILKTYRSTNDSGTPAVDRTLRTSDPSLLHLSLKQGNSDVVAFLMANLSGEIFSDLIKAEESIESMDYFKRADHVTVVVDGSKILKKSTRALELQNTFNFLERLVRSKLLSASAEISLMLSKADELKLGPGGDAHLKETISKIENEIIQPIQGLGAKVHEKVIELISEPVETCQGFDEALSVWKGHTDELPKKKAFAVESKRLVDHYKGNDNEA